MSFRVEPRSNDDEFVSPLRRFDNTFLTPHIGGSTIEAQENIGMEVAEKLARYSDNGTTTSSINLPAVALPEHGGSHRLLHIHRNVPGVMSAINSVFSENRINICRTVPADQRYGGLCGDRHRRRVQRDRPEKTGGDRGDHSQPRFVLAWRRVCADDGENSPRPEIFGASVFVTFSLIGK